MGRTLDEMIAAESADVRAKIDVRYAELVEEAKGLAALRRLSARSQADLAEKLHVKQPSISRMEKQADLLLSTLRDYVEGVGGKLQLVITLPDHAPVVLTGLGDLTDRASGRTLRSDGKKAAGRDRAVGKVGSAA